MSNQKPKGVGDVKITQKDISELRITDYYYMR
jgi:hypothetical protein